MKRRNHARRHVGSVTVSIFHTFPKPWDEFRNWLMSIGVVVAGFRRSPILDGRVHAFWITGAAQMSPWVGGVPAGYWGLEEESVVVTPAVVVEKGKSRDGGFVEYGRRVARLRQFGVMGGRYALSMHGGFR